VIAIVADRETTVGAATLMAATAAMIRAISTIVIIYNDATESVIVPRTGATTVATA